MPRKQVRGAGKAGDDEEAKPVSWWQTVPGVLTGLAAIITAATGLIVALTQTNSRRAADKPAVLEDRSASAQHGSGPATPARSDSSANESAASLPAGMEVKLGGGTTVIKILSAKLEPYNPENRALRFTIRHTNNGRYDANFWSASYRLLVDDVSRAPTNSLDEIVPSQSAKEGQVVFEVPLSTSRVVLQIINGEEKTQIPFVLNESDPRSRK